MDNFYTKASLSELDIFINNSNEGQVLVDDVYISLTDPDGNELGMDDVDITGNTVTIAVSPDWVRPSYWPDIDSLVSVGDHMWVGLMQIFDETFSGNPQNIQTFTSSQAFTVEIDGVPTNYGGGTLVELALNYASFSAVTGAPADFRCAIIKFYPQTAPWISSCNIAVPRTATKPSGYLGQMLDIRMCATGITSYTQNSSIGGRQVFLKKHVWLDTHQVIPRSGAFFASNISYIEEDFTNASALNNFISGSNSKITIFPTFTTDATTVASMFQESKIRKFGNITADSATSIQNSLRLTCATEIGNVSFAVGTDFQNGVFYNTELTSFGTLNIPMCTSLSQAWYNNPNLESLGVITTSASLTNLAYTWYLCRKLPSIEVTNCSGVTVTTLALLECTSLTSLILTNLRVGITVPPCKMDDAAFAAFFTALGTASGAQTIVITGNITLSAPTLAIATGKGFTITP